MSSTTHLRSGRPQNRGRVRGESDLLTCSVNQFRGPHDSFQEAFFPLLFLRQRTLQDVHRSPSFGSIFPTETEGGRTLELLSPRQRKRAQRQLFEAAVTFGGAPQSSSFMPLRLALCSSAVTHMLPKSPLGEQKGCFVRARAWTIIDISRE